MCQTCLLLLPSLSSTLKLWFKKKGVFVCFCFFLANGCFSFKRHHELLKFNKVFLSSTGFFHSNCTGWRVLSTIPVLKSDTSSCTKEGAHARVQGRFLSMWRLFLLLLPHLPFLVGMPHLLFWFLDLTNNQFRAQQDDVFPYVKSYFEPQKPYHYKVKSIHGDLVSLVTSFHLWFQSDLWNYYCCCCGCCGHGFATAHCTPDNSFGLRFFFHRRSLRRWPGTGSKDSMSKGGNCNTTFKVSKMGESEGKLCKKIRWGPGEHSHWLV